MLYKEAVAVQIDLGRFTTAAKLQKEIAELYEAESDLTAAMEVSASQCYTTPSMGHRLTRSRPSPWG